MKVIRTLVVLDRGKIIDSAEWEKIHSAYTDAIRAMVHPPGSKQFTIRKKSRKLNKLGKPTSQWNQNGITESNMNRLCCLDMPGKNILIFHKTAKVAQTTSLKCRTINLSQEAGAPFVVSNN